LKALYALVRRSRSVSIVVSLLFIRSQSGVWIVLTVHPMNDQVQSVSLRALADLAAKPLHGEAERLIRQYSTTPNAQASGAVGRWSESSAGDAS
jgi:hypothetical protein